MSSLSISIQQEIPLRRIADLLCYAFDRYGKVTTEILDFVYLEDFK